MQRCIRQIIFCCAGDAHTGEVEPIRTAWCKGKLLVGRFLYRQRDLLKSAGVVGIVIAVILLGEHIERIISAVKVIRYRKAELPVCGSGLHDPSIVGHAAFALNDHGNVFVLSRSRPGKIQRNGVAGFSRCGSFRYPKSAGIIQNRQFPFVSAVFRNSENSVGAFAACGGRNKEDSVRIQIKGRTGSVDIVYPVSTHTTGGIDHACIVIVLVRRTKPPSARTITIIGNTRIVIGKSIGCIPHFLCREEKHLVSIQDVLRINKVPINVWSITFAGRQNSVLLHRAEASAVKGITPVLCAAAMPVVGVWERIIKFYAAIFPCSKQRIGEQEKSVALPGARHIGFCIQHAPFDGAVIPCAEMNIVIAAVCAVIAADPTCTELYGFCGVIAGKGGCRQKTKHHAEHEQNADDSLFHWLFSSCSCGLNFPVPPLF